MCHARTYDPGPGHMTHNGGVEGRFLYVEGSFFYVHFLAFLAGKEPQTCKCSVFISLQDGLIFMGERVVVPKVAKSGLLKSIHNSHLVGVLNIARECLYWPGMTEEIKNYVSTCEACREYEQGQRKETLTSHERPSRPWEFVAADPFVKWNELPCDCGLF